LKNDKNGSLIKNASYNVKEHIYNMPKRVKNYLFSIYQLMTVGNYNIIARKDDKLDMPSVLYDLNRKVLDSGTVKADVYRSLCQYFCKSSFIPWWKKATLNILGLVAMPVLLGFVLTRTLLYLFKNNPESGLGSIAILEAKISIELLPIELSKTFESVRIAKMDLLIDSRLVKIIITMGPQLILRPYFTIKILYKLFYYCALIKKYQPSAIISYAEYSFTSSILTAYVEQLGVKHIYFMDGEKLLNIGSSFFRFSEAWVWDSHYASIFQRMKAHSSQFQVGLPLHHKYLINNKNQVRNNPLVLKYFWASEIRQNALKYINYNLARIKSCGVKVVVRAHPNHMNLFNKHVHHFFHGYCIEIPTEKSFMDSFMETDIILSTYSTTLYEAVLAGKTALICDFGDNLKRLSNLQYKILLENQLIPLSEYQSDIGLKYNNKG
jgi:hypothetical protein